MSDFRVIDTVSLEKVIDFCPQQSSEHLTPASNALYVVTDFTKRMPQLIDKDVLVDDALYMMKMGRVRSKMVIDAEGHFMGVVSSTDLSSAKVLNVAQLRNQSRSELTVENMMQSKERLPAINFNRMSSATIGDVLETLRELGHQHVLLVDSEQQLRGLISASDIARALKIPLNINEKAHSFKEIFDVIYKQVS